MVFMRMVLHIKKGASNSNCLDLVVRELHGTRSLRGVPLSTSANPRLVIDQGPHVGVNFGPGSVPKFMD